MDLFGLFRRPKLAGDAAPPLNPHADASADATVEPLTAGDADAAAPLAEPAPLPSPSEIRRRLFDAVASGDNEQLASLCREHRDFILQQGPAWLDVPEEFRANPAAAEWYGDGLREIARFCADQMRGGTEPVSADESARAGGSHQDVN